MHHLIELKLFKLWFVYSTRSFISPLFSNSTDKITKAFIANVNLVYLLITGHYKK